ncbi:hypothetical protein D3C77_58170 [compost metagenome]|uniref:DUF6279 family lipoprotein n=1 Tax=Pseudomonas TaxID=286 RepID=UPI000CFAAF53|nr:MULTISPECIES: DUF6279 family lipoprotein [unclassified Pseudomonas]MCW2267642.1 Asp-tRNA(Asn)/Glu-tRNA(Gln) amidotransferase A subunit family amidase [Pseudomonas sp. JUb96]PRA61240.1 hypothetical protein CQ065_18355 [Pseudomonas sp. MYb187]
MYACLPKYLRTLLLLVLPALLVLACSRIDLAYRNLDMLVPWSLNDYLNMNRQQKTWLNQRLKQHLAWHCRTQLPGYLTWIDEVRQMVADNQVTDQQLQLRTQEAKQAIAKVADQITPSAAQLLRAMDDEQVHEMRQAFAEDISERQAKYVKTPLARQIEQRAERMEKRLTPWLGELSSQQRLRIMTWSQGLGEQNRQWIANRANWQAHFSAAMDQRHTDAFEPQLVRLLKNRESLWTPEYRQAYQRTEKAARQLLVDLMAQSSEQQRTHLEQKLDQVRKDFSELKCMKG